MRERAAPARRPARVRGPARAAATPYARGCRCHDGPDRADRILVVDDQALVRAGFAAILDLEPDLTVVGEVADGSEVLARARETSPDVVLMDIRMPGIDGIAATRTLLEHGPPG